MTHYQILGVRGDSDPATIRAAYLRLIKQYHPDRVAAVDLDRVARINRAYWILRDPARRRDYDWHFHRIGLALSRNLRLETRHGGGYSPLAQRGWFKFASALMISAFFGAMLPGDTLATVAGRDSPPPAVADLTMPTVPAAANGFRFAPEQEIAGDFGSGVELASYATLSDASGVSRRCFGQLRRHPGLSLADTCISFDLAFAYWYHGDFRGWEGEDYFLSTNMTRRHRAALSRVGIDDARGRIEAVRGRTFSSIMNVLRVRRQAAAEAMGIAEQSE